MTEIDTSREAVESLVSLLRHNSLHENLEEIDIIAHAEAIAILPALLARAEKAEAERDEAAAALTAALDEIERLTVDRNAMHEALNKLEVCDASKAEHIIITEGRYRFCAECGETMTDKKIRDAEKAVAARAALKGSTND